MSRKIKSLDVSRLREHLESAKEREIATIEFCERTDQRDNPQFQKLKVQASARAELLLAILRAVELGDYVDLRTYTKMS